eukprot:UN17702
MVKGGGNLQQRKYISNTSNIFKNYVVSKLKSFALKIRCSFDLFSKSSEAK